MATDGRWTRGAGIDDVRVGTWTSPAGPSGCTVVLPAAGHASAPSPSAASRPARARPRRWVRRARSRCATASCSPAARPTGWRPPTGSMRWLEAHGYRLPGRDRDRADRRRQRSCSTRAATDPAVRPDAAAGWAACEAATERRPGRGLGRGRGRRDRGQGRRHRPCAGGPARASPSDGSATSSSGRWWSTTPWGRSSTRTAGSLVGTRAAAELSRVPGGPDGPGARPARRARPAGPGWVDRSRRADGQHRHRVRGHQRAARQARRPPGRRPRPRRHRPGRRPAHTSPRRRRPVRLATRQVDATLDHVAALAAEVVAEAARRGPLHATAGHGLPAVGD